MIGYVARRVVWAGFLLLFMNFATFVLFYLLPVEPARSVCGGARATPGCIQRANDYLGLDEPIAVQYWLYVNRLVVHQDLGESYVTRQSVNDIIAAAAPVTASLVVGGILVSLLVALCAGVYAALHAGSVPDRALMAAVLVGVSAPAFWFGLVLSYLVGHRLGWTPLGGYADFFNVSPGHPGGPLAWAHHLVLPWIVFALFTGAFYSRMVRTSVLEALNEDYVRTARAKGAPASRVLRAHVIRNAMLPIVTMVGMDFGIALGGAFFIEAVFALPGLGPEAIQALNLHDLMVTQGVIVFATTMIVLFTLIVDVLYGWLDPRIRISASSPARAV